MAIISMPSNSKGLYDGDNGKGIHDVPENATVTMSTVKKQSTQNIDYIDVTNPTDNENFHQFIDKVDFSDVSINLNNGEITPKLICKNITFSNPSVLDSFDFSSNSSGAPSITLKANEEKEPVLNIGDSLLYSSSVDIRDYSNINILKSYTNLSGFTSNKIGDKFDAFIVDKVHSNFTDLESLSCMEFNIKDFNLESVDSIDFHRNPHGKIKDYDSKFNPIKYMFAPYCESFDIFSKEGIFPKKGSKYSKGYFDDVTEVFVDYLKRTREKTEIEGESVIRRYPIECSLRAGIHNIGYIDPIVENNDIYVGTKVKCLDDFIIDSDKSYIYNNISRPMIFKKVKITEDEDDPNLKIYTFGDFIKPVIAQSYRFDKDYILSKIVPNFIFPSKLEDEYYNELGYIKLIVHAGFLIDGKINENGIISTRIFSNYTQIMDAMNNGIDFNYPIFIPAKKDFFIGFSLITDKENADFRIKCIDNGKYDKSGNLITFPSNVITKMFMNGEEFPNKLIKMEMFVNTYDTSNTYNITLNHLWYYVDRAILFSSDFYPSDTLLNYSLNTAIEKIDIKKNTEYIADSTKETDGTLTITMGTKNKYVSPIVNLNGLNVFKKRYTIEKQKYDILTSYETKEDYVSILKFRIDNINSWYDSKLINADSTSTSLNTYYYILRVDFDYHMNLYDYNTDEQIIKSISINAINKVSGEKFRILSDEETNESKTSIDGNRIDIINLNENGWKRANCEYILSKIINPSSIKKFSDEETVEWYPFIAFIDQFEIEVSLIIRNRNWTNIGVEGIKNIMCSLDTIVSEDIVENKEIKL